MPHRSSFQFPLLLAAATLLTSCTTPVYRLYSGTELQPEEISVLIDSPDLNVFIDAVDGMPPPDAHRFRKFYGNNFDGSFRIELRPGKHTLSVRYGSPDLPGHFSVQNLVISFYAEAGKVYTLKASLDTVRMTGKAWVEETGDETERN